MQWLNKVDSLLDRRSSALPEEPISHPSNGEHGYATTNGIAHDENDDGSSDDDDDDAPLLRTASTPLRPSKTTPSPGRRTNMPGSFKRVRRKDINDDDSSIASAANVVTREDAAATPDEPHRVEPFLKQGAEETTLGKRSLPFLQDAFTPSAGLVTLPPLPPAMHGVINGVASSSSSSSDDAVPPTVRSVPGSLRRAPRRQRHSPPHDGSESMADDGTAALGNHSSQAHNETKQAKELHSMRAKRNEETAGTEIATTNETGGLDAATSLDKRGEGVENGAGAKLATPNETAGLDAATSLLIRDAASPLPLGASSAEDKTASSRVRANTTSGTPMKGDFKASNSDESNDAMHSVDLQEQRQQPVGEQSGRHQTAPKPKVKKIDPRSESSWPANDDGSTDGSEPRDTFIPTLKPAMDNLASAAPHPHSPKPQIFMTPASSSSDHHQQQQQPPRHIELRSEFDVDDVAVQHGEWNALGLPPYEPRMNRYGVVRARLLRAQRLPCSVGSAVQAVLSLPPWKGKVRAKATARTFYGELDSSGVCASWDEDDWDNTAVPMTHAYSSDDSPIPSIKVALVFKPLGMFEFIMASATISCRALLQAPNTQFVAWFAADSSDQHGTLLQVEATFEPQDGDDDEDDAEVLDADVPIDVVEVSSRCTVDTSLQEGSARDKMTTVAATVRPTPGRRVARAPPEPSSSLHGGRSSTSRTYNGKALPSHLLRIKAHYTPASCCVCGSSIMSGLRKSLSFRCEQCGVDCCSDCRLQVDYGLPCGSAAARQARDRTIQYRLTPANILKVVAPVENSSRMDAMPPDASLNGDANVASIRGIGTLTLEFGRGRIFATPLPYDAELKDDVIMPKVGDYYVRVHRNDVPDTVRTRTVQNTGYPNFESGELHFVVPHYGVEFRFDLIDASTEGVVGGAVMTAAMMLQYHRDAMYRRGVLMSIHGQKSFAREKMPVVLELRASLRDGFAESYFQRPEKAKDNGSHGAIVGSLEVQIAMAESFEWLYGNDPYECPSRPAEKRDIGRVQVHIARLGQIVDDIKQLIGSYQYLVSWQNPILTGFSLVIFVRYCLYYDPRFFSTAPVTLMMCYMVMMAWAGRDRVKRRFVKFTMGEKSRVATGSSIHRSVGRLSIQLGEGRNIRSLDLGLTGNAGCKILYNPSTDLFPHKDTDAPSIELGHTTFVYSTSPAWPEVIPSLLVQRLKGLMQTFDNGPETKSQDDVAMPVLQPVVMERNGAETAEPWTSSRATISFEVVFSDVMNLLLPGAEYALGRVVVPLSLVVEKGTLSGWFRLQDESTLNYEPTFSSDPDGAMPCVRLSLSWKPPAESPALSIGSEQELSAAVREELERAVKLVQTKRQSFFGSSVEAINTVRGISDTIQTFQNYLGSILDFIEAARNAVNFTDPLKSIVVLCAIFAFWLLLALVPARVLIFACGAGQYTATFVSRFGRVFFDKKSNSKGFRGNSTNASKSPVGVWIMNGLRGLPTDEDLRKMYFWENVRAENRAALQYAENRRNGRLSKLWRAQWSSNVRILSDDHDALAWEDNFAIIQGHRFIWWRSAEEFDLGATPVGMLFLKGHAGLATPSPIELRAVTTDDLLLVCCIFGRSESFQKRVTFLAPTTQVKADFEKAVQFATSSKND